MAAFTKETMVLLGEMDPHFEENFRRMVENYSCNRVLLDGLRPPTYVAPERGPDHMVLRFPKDT